MKKVLYYCGLFLVSATFVKGLEDVEKVKMDVVVRVVDEGGETLVGCEVVVAFSHTAVQQIKLKSSTKPIHLEYDGSAPVEVSYRARNKVGVRVNREGYWQSRFAHRFTQKERIDGKTDGSPNGHYRKEFTVVLRKKVNPRPLFVHRVDRFDLPGLGKPYGFDLEKADWVAPHGKGVISDFIFQINREAGEAHPAYSSQIIWTFSEPQDGVLHVKETDVPSSELHLGRAAPGDGYADRYSRSVGIRKEGVRFFPDSDPPLPEVEAIEGCWFRVRSRTNPKGEFEARYGKIIGTVDYSTRGEKPPQVSFVYYFAPDTSRSLEWNGESLVPNANLQSVNKR